MYLREITILITYCKFKCSDDWKSFKYSSMTLHQQNQNKYYKLFHDEKSEFCQMPWKIKIFLLWPYKKNNYFSGAIPSEICFINWPKLIDKARTYPKWSIEKNVPSHFLLGYRHFYVTWKIVSHRLKEMTIKK